MLDLELRGKGSDTQFAWTIPDSEWSLLKTLWTVHLCARFLSTWSLGEQVICMYVTKREWKSVCMCACSLHNATIVIGNLQRGCDWILHYFSRFCHVGNVWICLIAEDPISHSCWVTFNFGWFSWCCFCSPCLLLCACMCVVSVIVKHPVLPPCAVDGRSRNPLYYYFEAGTDCNIRVLHTTLPGFDFIPTFGHPNQRMKPLQLLMVHTQLQTHQNSWSL